MSMEEVKRLDTSSIVQEYDTILVQEKTEEPDDVFYSRMSLIKSRNAPPPGSMFSKRKTTRSTHDKSGTKPIAQRKRPYGIFYKENLC